MKRLNNRLVVPGAFKVRTPSKAIATNFEREILRLKELCAHRDIAVETSNFLRDCQTMNLEIVNPVKKQ